MIKFGTGGFRGIIGDDFNKENVQTIAQALSDIVNSKDNDKKPIIVGYDNRFMSDYFATWMCEVFASNQVKTLLYHTPVPTPAVMSATKDMKNDFGVMITASHNPYIFNGVKLFLTSGIDADVEFTNMLERQIKKVTSIKSMKINIAKDQGLVEDFYDIDRYINSIKKFINPQIRNNRAKILFDNMFGVGKTGLVRLASEYNIFNFEAINTSRDAFFNFELPNPTEATLRSLKPKVINECFEYAIATDSDADRLGVIDENGDYVDSNDILASLYYYLVKYRGEKGDIVKNCSTSILIDKLSSKLGFNCHEVDVGFKNISSKMKQTNALIGGESSGGLTVRNYLFGKDSVFSAMLFIEMQIMMQLPVSQIIKQVHSFAEYDYVTLEESIVFDNENILEKFQSENPFNAKNCSLFNNNIKYYFDDGSWLLIRKSGTEPVLRIVIEQKTSALANEMLNKAKEFLNNVKK